ncbi:phage tail domain-containing protein [Ornithinibacillus bavariensis]|uniref:phage tail domain-containing protein n=1 Tax=Ornithinibacillus bavariensis TaxID=545502 RepID=UPI000ED31247|nr:hypothetical protein [Ornithinibacillus sp.]
MSNYTFIGDPLSESSVSINNGIRLADFGVHLLADSEEPALPQTRDKTLVIPGRHGEYNFGSYFDARQLNLSCGFNNQATLADAQQLIRELNTMLLDEYGRPKEVELVYDYEPDKLYKATLSGVVPVNRISRAGTFVLPLKASDPFAYSRIYADEIVWGSDVVTFEYNYLLGHDGLGGAIDITSPKAFIITVDGYNVKPKFEIEGSATSLNISANGNTIALPPFNNETWKIDCENYTAVRNGVNVFGDLSFGEFVLYSGENQVSIGGNGINIKMRVKFRDKYM